MEIEQLRKEINQLLENVVEHSDDYANNRPIPSLEISFILTKISKLQEAMIVLQYLLEKKELEFKKESNPVKLLNKIEVTSENKEHIINDNDEASETKTSEIVEENINQKPIQKLIDALSLNDRYLFANELFNKDMNAFNELVKSIDNSSSFVEANELLSKLDWEEENEHVLSFINLVERRFL
jgi:hypothetical protein